MLNRTKVIAPLLLAAAALGGCSNDALMSENASLVAENNELRERNAQLENTVSMLDGERTQIDAELSNLRAENQNLRNRPSGNSGFENIGGVNATVLDSGEVIVEVAGDVLFASGRVDIKNASKQTLDQIAGVINSRYSGRLIRIAGHSDSDPIKKSKWKTNERLSAERALAVEEYLAGKGVENDRMYVAAFGPARPKGTKKDSRRVEIVVLNIPAP